MDRGRIGPGLTLILACLTHERIVVAADRRLTLPDGSCFDDDANKAVFYGGRVALAYTGLAVLEGMDTADWLAGQLAPFDGIEAAMDAVAGRATQVLKKVHAVDKRVAFLASGWATFQAQPPVLPFACLATNFMDEKGAWLAAAQPAVTVRTRFLPASRSHSLVVAGQGLYPRELLDLDRMLRRCARHRVGPAPFARLLGTQSQLVSAGHDERAARVGPGLVIQALAKEAVLGGSTILLTPLTPAANSFLYVRSDGATSPFQFPVVVGGGGVFKAYGQELKPGVKSFFEA